MPIPVFGILSIRAGKAFGPAALQAGSVCKSRLLGKPILNIGGANAFLSQCSAQAFGSGRPDDTRRSMTGALPGRRMRISSDHEHLAISGRAVATQDASLEVKRATRSQLTAKFFSA
jgi:hypothetical protein